MEVDVVVVVVDVEIVVVGKLLVDQVGEEAGHCSRLARMCEMCSFGLKSAHHFPFVSQFLLGFLISKQTTASTTKFRFQFQKKFYRNSDTGENGQKIIRLRSISPDVEI